MKFSKGVPISKIQTKYNSRLKFSKPVFLRALEEKGVSTMAAELDFSPPEIPEPTFMENVLRYGLFFGAIFQLICVLAIILPVSKSHKTGKRQLSALGTPGAPREPCHAPQPTLELRGVTAIKYYAPELLRYTGAMLLRCSDPFLASTHASALCNPKPLAVFASLL
ncbi:Protein MANBAL isoform X1 [Aix galericulata]|nr:Protein MANBAL isoform X1 [Aix galericulata]